MRKTIIIPARYGSTRFEGKALALIAGKPMILHVCSRLRPLGVPIVVATDDRRIYNVVMNAGYQAKMTGECRSGTDRVYEAGHSLEADIYINVQGDEPLINPDDVQKVIDVKTQNMGMVVGSMTFLKEGEMENPDIVKVKVSDQCILEIITRMPIDTLYRQCGLYAFTLQELKQFANTTKQEQESIELTRFSNCIRMVLISDGHAVDRPKDIKIIEDAIRGAGSLNREGQTGV